MIKVQYTMLTQLTTRNFNGSNVVVTGLSTADATKKNRHMLEM